jgi:ribosome-associated translation inhibitor RaiA
VPDTPVPRLVDPNTTEATMTRQTQITAQDVRVTIRGDLPGIGEYAQAKIDKLIRHAPEPVLDAHVWLLRHGDPAVTLPITAQANLDVNGRLARAQAQAATAREAIDLLERRLSNTLSRLGRNWEAIRGRTPNTQAHEWRHGWPSAPSPVYYPRTPRDRQIVRHKSFTLPRETVDEAAFEMDCMDYDFHLFTEIHSGADSVVYRAGPNGYQLAQTVTVDQPRLRPYAVPLTFSEHPAPTLTLTAAVDRLNLMDETFAFFRNHDSHRGNVLYRRYDGHYGLITPAA